MRMLIAVLVLLALAAGAGGWYWQANSQPRVEFRTAKVQRGDLLSTIESTGTLEPEEVVDVGAQVEGLVQSFGKDAEGKVVNYRSLVEANMVLAQIDDAVYKADLNTAKAQLAQARSSLQKGEADVAQASAKMLQAEQDWARAQKLGPSDALSQSDYDTYKANLDTSKANVAVAASEVTQAQAGIEAAQAALDKAQRNLDFCVIRSPVNGVIIDRRVNIGQTVVSSLNAPSLFLIAKDLKRMQVWVAVNEADIDHIRSGQNVTFTCDALQGETFKGTVNKVRLNATMTQNVVTYTVEVDADNSSGRLLPYMTANVQFEVRRDANVLMVPNAALRWYPSAAAEVVPDVRAQWKPVEEEDASASGNEQRKARKQDKKPKERKGTIWAKEGNLVRPVQVTLGPTDDIRTEVSADNLKEDQEIVVGETIAAEDGGGEQDPFLPHMNRKK